MYESRDGGWYENLKEPCSTVNSRFKKDLRLHIDLHKGAFINYVDKMRGGGGQKMSVFVHAQGIKTVHEGGGGQKMTKFCPRSC